MQTSLIVHANGGEPLIVKCAQCSAELGEHKAAPRCPDGRVRFFCVPERGNPPEYSCYIQYVRSRH